MSFLVAEKVTRIYRDNGSQTGVPVLHDVSVGIAEGEFVCLMGPSGSGKSTLLTILGAMNRPTQGRLLIDGIDVYALSDERRADFRAQYLGFVFQQHHLLPFLTAVENVMLPLTTLPLKGNEKRRRALDVLEKVGLEGKAARLPSQLSGGEQGRLAIARAIVNDPPLLLADEPTGTLDTKTGDDIMRVFMDLNGRGQAIFMVTHNPVNAALAHRVLHIRDGRLNGETGGAERTVKTGAKGMPTVLLPEIAQSLSNGAHGHSSGAAVREFQSVDTELRGRST